jgi:hypothetical protein
VRRARLTALVLEDTRVADARVVLHPENQAETEEYTLPAGTILDVQRPFTFTPPKAEQGAGITPANVSTVHVILPVHLSAGVTLANASQAIHLSLDSYLSSRRADAPLNVDSLAAAIRDDTRFGLVRPQVIVTVESRGPVGQQGTTASRFLQLTDGVGVYAPTTNEVLQKGTIEINPQEGGV